MNARPLYFEKKNPPFWKRSKTSFIRQFTILFNSSSFSSIHPFTQRRGAVALISPLADGQFLCPSLVCDPVFLDHFMARYNNNHPTVRQHAKKNIQEQLAIVNHI